MTRERVLKGNVFFEKYIRKHILKYIVTLAIYGMGFIVGIRIF